MLMDRPELIGRRLDLCTTWLQESLHFFLKIFCFLQMQMESTRCKAEAEQLYHHTLSEEESNVNSSSCFLSSILVMSFRALLIFLFFFFIHLSFFQSVIHFFLFPLLSFFLSSQTTPSLSVCNHPQLCKTELSKFMQLVHVACSERMRDTESSD